MLTEPPHRLLSAAEKLYKSNPPPSSSKSQLAVLNILKKIGVKDLRSEFHPLEDWGGFSLLSVDIALTADDGRKVSGIFRDYT